MNENPHPQTERVLQSLLDYVRDLIANAPKYSQDKSQRVVVDLFSRLGKLEGQRLKSAGLLSREFGEYCSLVSEKMGILLQFKEPLKVPFTEKRVSISPLFEFPEQLQIWQGFFSQLLSVYAMVPISFAQKGNWPGRLDLTVIETEKKLKPASPHPPRVGEVKSFKHSLNNYLGGILSLTSLLQREHPQDDRLGLIMDSAKKIEELSREAFN